MTKKLHIKKNNHSITLIDEEDIQDKLDEKADATDLESLSEQIDDIVAGDLDLTTYAKKTDLRTDEIADENTYSNISNAEQTQESINAAIDDKLGALSDIDLVKVVGTKPTASADTMNKLYLVAESSSITEDNYEIFITVRSGSANNYSYTWEKVDTARVNLSNYIQKSSTAGLVKNDGSIDTATKLNVSQGSTNANKNVVTDASGNITTEAKPTIPTKTSQLTNDSNYIEGNGTSSQFLKADGSVFDISTHNQGGTNLLQGTQNFNGARGLLQRYSIGTYRNLEYVLVNNSNETSYTDIFFPIPANTFDYGEKYTLSFWVNGSGEIRIYNFGNTNYVKTKVINCTSGGLSLNTYNDGGCTFTLDNTGWKRYFVTWELNPTSNSSNDLNVDKLIILRTMAGAAARFAGVMYERGEIPHDWSPSPLDNSEFDYSKIKGTDNTVGYIKALKLQIGSAYQDKPIKIETYQRNRKTTNTINIAFQNLNSVDPSITTGFFNYYGDENFKVYLYKESAGVWSLITSKGHADKYGEMMVKVSNPNPGISITKLDTHIESLPSNTSSNPLMEANYIDFSSTEKTKLAGIATGANKTTIINDLTTGGAANALSAEQGKTLKSLVDDKITNGTGTVTSTNIANKTIVNDDISDSAAIAYSKLSGVVSSTDSRLSNPRIPVFTQIPASSSNTVDLNTYKTGGFYYINHDANMAPYVTNCPLSGTNNKSFFLLVETWGTNSTYVKQTLTYYHTNTTYTRTCANNTWYNNGAWTKISQEGHNHDGTYIKTGTGTVTSTNIADKTIVNGDIADNAAIAYSKLSGVAASTHTHSYLPLSGGSLTGPVVLSPNSDTTNAGNIPFAGSINYDTDFNTTLKNRKSGFYTYSDGTKWWNLISNRHRNGTNDGTSYGVYLKTPLQQYSHLIWGKQTGPNSFMTEKTLIDNENMVKHEVVNNVLTRATNNQSTAGYFKILTIEISGNYIDSPIQFTINRRLTPTTNVQFYVTYYQKDTSSSSNPRYYKLSQCYYDGQAFGIYVKQTVDNAGAGTFDIYTNAEAWSDLSVTPIITNNVRSSPANVTITPKDEFVTSLPSGCTQATRNPNYVAGDDSRLSNARTPTSHTDSNGAYGKATTSVWGHTKLNSATNSTDETTAATPKAVKAAYDLANEKAPSSHTHTKSQITDFPTSMTPTSHASTGTGYGASSASNYGHAMASSTTPIANGTAAVGSETTKFARGDHVHPIPSVGTVQTLTLANTSAMSGTVKWVEKNGWATVFWENFKCTTTTTGFTPVANLPSGKGAPATIYGYLNTSLTGTNGNGIHFRVGSTTLDCRVYSTSAAMYGHITYPLK